MIDKKQLRIGEKIELEHRHLFPKTIQKTMAERIARDHLRESPRYYKELTKMEKRLHIK